ncbi:Spc98 family-domain-containing protein [Suillus cothurnatus]|nr:Spc98 family-domain-containing protein [Suillus cothurnatus]
MSLFSDAWSHQCEHNMDSGLGILLHITPQFFVPRMVDKPQDAIGNVMHTISSQEILRVLEVLLHLLCWHQVLWAKSVASSDQHSDQVVSWDVMCQSHPNRSYNTPFLTEQSSDVSASAQYHVVCANELELLESLRMTFLGTSSFLHTWNPISETFVSCEGPGNLLNTLIINIGTLMRRLEVFLSALRTRRKEDSEMVRAFSHVLSMMLVYLRDQLYCGPLSNPCIPVSSKALSILWGFRRNCLLSSITLPKGTFTDGLGLSPSQYSQFKMKPVALLSRIYTYLDTHFRKSSSQSLVAVFAYLLTTSSKNYLQALCRLVAYADSNSQWAAAHFDQASPEDDGVLFAEDDELPSFIPRDLAEVLPAQKSLKLLIAAKPGHPVLNPPVRRSFIIWVWSARDIQDLWRTGSLSGTGDVAPTIGPHSLPDLVSTDSNLHGCGYQFDLVEFRIFDLESGSNEGNTFNERSMYAAFGSFILSFPPVLPSITPDLGLLTNLVFSPLISDVAFLSSALLSIFLDQNSFLYMHDYLVPLRSHILLTSPSFKSRLTAALFSDADDREVVAGGRKPFTLSRQRSRSATGLFLRTVIVDSQDTRSFGPDDRQQEQELSSRHIAEEAEVCLGFAIRDLASDTGRERWLNPLSLNFLCLDYKFLPLDVIFTPDTTSKYQRIFAFLLCLIRVESAIRAAFRMTHQNFRGAFVRATLSAYIFDVAIGGNFDAFPARITACRWGTSSEFTDVFSVADTHSAVLNDNLSTCLMRSAQRAAGDLLRGSLELIPCQASSVLDVLFAASREKMSTLIKVLEVLLEKDLKSSQRQELLFALKGQSDVHHAPGGVEALRHLILRLDINEWWKDLNS